MTIGYNLEEFNGKPVHDYDRERGIEHPGTVCYRVRLSYEDWDGGNSLPDTLQRFAQDPNADKVTELVIGIWDFEGGGSEETRDMLIEVAPRLKNLEALMFGDITYEENEMSWIEQCDLSRLVKAFPNLKDFRARGGTGLELNNLSHPKLEKLVLETGGMWSKTINDAIGADCPELKHLELWLGVEDYGFDGSVHNLRPVLTGSVYPKLEYLGIRNSEIADEVAVALRSTEAADVSAVKVQGSTFVLTGALHNLTRSEAKKKLEAMGAEVSSSVSKNTNYLVAGEKAGSKMEKAKELGVTVLTEADLLVLLGESADQVSNAGGSILDRIQTLDLSLGTLSDKGAEALYENPKIKALEKLDIHYHFVSDEWIDKLKSLGIEVDASDQQDLDDDWRTPYVTE